MGVVFVTGASAGFGAAIARRIVREGRRVVGTGRRAERLAALADELGPDFVPLVFDIRDVDAIAGALDALSPADREIDVLVNNAGLALGTGPAQESDLAQWRTMIDTNVVGLVAITRALLPSLIRRRGLVVNLASIAANWPYPGGNVYGGTKAFVRQFSLGLRCDLHGTGVRVTCIEPGLSRSEFTLVRTSGDAVAEEALYRGADPLVPDDIAETVFWIAQLPPHMNVNSLEMMPVSQSWAPVRIARAD